MFLVTDVEYKSIDDFLLKELRKDLLQAIQLQSTQKFQLACKTFINSLLKA